MREKLMKKMIIFSFMLIAVFMLGLSNAVANGDAEPPCFEVLSCDCSTESCITSDSQGLTTATAVFGSCELYDDLIGFVDGDVNGYPFGVLGFGPLPPGGEITVNVFTNGPIGDYVTTINATANDPSGNSTTVQCVTECSIPLCIEIDIKPMSCPNPLNVKDKGVLSVAILGTDELDVTQTDPATVKLEGVSPLRWAYDDVATPGIDSDGCNTYGADGYTDLVLKFDAQEVIAALGVVNDGDVLMLMLTGNQLDEFGGTPIAGEDAVIIVKKGK